MASSQSPSDGIFHSSHDLCEAAVDYVLGNVNTVQYLVRSIEDLTGQSFTRDRIKCLPGVPATQSNHRGKRQSSATAPATVADASPTTGLTLRPGQVFAGYMWRRARPDCAKGDIVLVEEHLVLNREPTAAEVSKKVEREHGEASCGATAVASAPVSVSNRPEQPARWKVLEQHYSGALQQTERNVRHELIHAFDDARGYVESADCFHQACSEIRAARLSGDCFVGEEAKRKRLELYQGGLKCVRRRATTAVEMNPVCKGFAERSVETVFKRCYSDYEPFAGPVYAMGSYGEDRFDNEPSMPPKRGKAGLASNAKRPPHRLSTLSGPDAASQTVPARAGVNRRASAAERAAPRANSASAGAVSQSWLPADHVDADNRERERTTDGKASGSGHGRADVPPLKVASLRQEGTPHPPPQRVKARGPARKSVSGTGASNSRKASLATSRPARPPQSRKGSRARNGSGPHKSCSPARHVPVLTEEEATLRLQRWVRAIVVLASRVNQQRAFAARVADAWRRDEALAAVRRAAARRTMARFLHQAVLRARLARATLEEEERQQQQQRQQRQRRVVARSRTCNSPWLAEDERLWSTPITARGASVGAVIESAVLARMSVERVLHLQQQQRYRAAVHRIECAWLRSDRSKVATANGNWRRAQELLVWQESIERRDVLRRHLLHLINIQQQCYRNRALTRGIAPALSERLPRWAEEDHEESRDGRGDTRTLEVADIRRYERRLFFSNAEVRLLMELRLLDVEPEELARRRKNEEVTAAAWEESAERVREFDQLLLRMQRDRTELSDTKIASQHALITPNAADRQSPSTATTTSARVDRAENRGALQTSQASLSASAVGEGKVGRPALEELDAAVMFVRRLLGSSALPPLSASAVPVTQSSSALRISGQCDWITESFLSPLFSHKTAQQAGAQVRVTARVLTPSPSSFIDAAGIRSERGSGRVQRGTLCTLEGVNAGKRILLQDLLEAAFDEAGSVSRASPVPC